MKENDKGMNFSILKSTFLLLASLSTWGWGAGWVVELPEGGGPYGYWNSLAIDSNGNPHAVYRTSDTGGSVRYVKKVGNVWTGENIQDGLAISDGHTSIALTPSNVPWVSYYVSGMGLRVAVRGSTSWNVTTVDPQGTGHTSIKIDALGNAHLSYKANNGVLKYAKWDGVAWSTYTVDSSGPTGFWSSLALDSASKPLISYYNSSNKDLLLARWDGVWSTQTVVSAGDVGSYSSLALDSMGHPMISYIEASVGVKLATLNGNSWAVQTVWSGSAAFTSLALDQQNVPFVAFGGQTGGVKISSLLGNVWTPTIVGTNSGDYCALAFKGEDKFVVFGSYYFSFAKSSGGLDVPSNVTALSTSSNTITWGWVDNSANEVGFRVLRSPSGTPLSSDLPANTTYWIETGLTPNTKSEVFIETYNSLTTKRSGLANAYTRSNVPANTRIQNVVRSDVSLAWDTNGNPTGTIFTAEYSLQPSGSFSSFYTGSVSTATAFNLLPFTTYYFRVKSSNQMGLASAYDVAVATVTLNSPPLAPTMISPTVTTNTIVWKWTDQSANEAGFRVRRSSDGLILSGDLPPNTISWTQTDISPSTLSRVYVEAFNDIGSSSSTPSVRYTLAVEPADLVVIASTGNTREFSWSTNGNPETVTYRTFYGKYASFSSYNTIESTVPWVKVGSLLGSTTYYAKVHAKNGENVLSAPSNVVSFFIPPQPPFKPGQPYSSAITTHSIRWSWYDYGDEIHTGYRVINADTGLPVSGELTPTGVNNSWTQTNLSPNRPTRVLIQSFNDVGSTDSDTSLVTYTKANPPVGTYVESVETNAVNLRWLDNGNSTHTVYDVEKSLSSGGSFLLASSGTWTAVRLTGLLDDATHYFHVRARNGANEYTLFDSTVSAFVPASTPPPAPTGFSVLARSTNTITWGWTDGSQKEQGFRVLSESGLVVLATLSANTTYWVQTGLTPNSRYAVQVEAFNEFGSARTSRVFGDSYEFTLSAPPDQVTITEVTPNTASLSWLPNGNPVNTYYNLHVSNDGGAFAKVSLYDKKTFSTVQNLVQGSTYSFKITADNEGYYNPDSPASIVVSTTIPFGPPTKPQMDDYHFIRTTSSITWKWLRSVNATGYNIYRSSDNALLVGGLSSNRTEWTQFGLGVNSRQTLRFEAFNAYGSSSTVDNDNSLPNPPINTQLMDVTATSIKLGWSANGNPDSTTYRVEYSTNGWQTHLYKWEFYQTQTSLTDLTPNTTYFIRVRAEGSSSNTNSNYDQPVTVYLDSGPPPAPQIQTVKKSTSSLEWVWKDAPNETGYRVFRASDSLNLSGDLPAGTTSFTLAHLTPGKVVKVSIQAFNLFGSSSSLSTETTYPLPPSNLRALSSESSGIRLAWDSDENPPTTYYEIHAGTDPDHMVVKNKYIMGKEAFVSNLISGATYFFKVGSWNGDYGDPSFFSSIVSSVVPFGPPGAVALEHKSTPNSITWSWGKLNNADGYRVFDSSGGLLSEDLSPDTTSWVKTGLSPVSKYSVYVEAFNLFGSSRTTLSIGQTKSNPVKNVTILSTRLTSVTLSWDINGNPPEVYYYVNQATWSFPAYRSDYTYVGRKSSATIDNLAPGTTYYFQVEGWDSGDSLLPIVSTVTPTSPRAPLAKDKTSQSIVWEWIQEVPQATGYRILATEDRRDLSGLLPSNRRNWDLSGLNPNSSVDVVLKIETSTGAWYSNPSGPVYSLPGVPSNLRMVATGNNKASLAWDSNNNPDGTEYSLIRTSPGTDPVEVFVGTTTSAIVTGLRAQTLYSLRVQAIGVSGRSELSDPLKVTISDPIQFDLEGDGWTLETVEEGGSLEGEFLTMGLDSRGDPHLFYSSGFGHDLKTAKREGGVWSLEVLQPNAAIASGMSVDVDGQDNFYVSFSNRLRLQSLVINEKRVLAQRVVPLDSFTNNGFTLSVNGQGFQGSSIRARANGDLVMAYGLDVSPYYIGGNSGHYLFYEAVRPGGAKGIENEGEVENDSLWEKNVIASTSTPLKNGGYGSGVGEIDLALDSAGGSHAVFFHCRDREDFPNALGDIVYARREGAVWVTETVESQVATEESSLSIAIDSDNKVHILYTDNEHRAVRHAVRASSGWTIETVEESKAQFYSFARLEIDGQGRPHAAYLAVTGIDYPDGEDGDAVFKCALRYAVENNRRWDAETIESGDNVGFEPSLAVDPLGNAHIAYRNETLNRVTYASKNSRALRVERIVEKEGARIVLNGTRGRTSVLVLPDTFDDQVTLTLGSPDFIPHTGLENKPFFPTGIALEISVRPNASPKKPVQIVFPFSRNELKGIQIGSLILAQYNESTGDWEPLVTRVDTLGNNLTASIDRWGSVQIMYQALSDSATDVVAFPNPMRPGIPGHESMTFDQIPPGSTIKIFTFRGELIQEITADGVGQARWDGKNQNGEPVSSGVYLVRVEGAGYNKLLKVVVQR